MSRPKTNIRQLITRMDSETIRKLKIIAAQECTTINAIVADAIHGVLTKRGIDPGPDLARIARRAA